MNRSALGGFAPQPPGPAPKAGRRARWRLGSIGWGVVLACAAALGLAVSGCGKSGGPSPAPDPARPRPLVIGVSLLNLSSEFIVMLERALTSRAKELGVRLILNDAQRSAERQVQQIENFIAQGVDAILLNPCEAEASSPAVDKARAAGIPVVNFNSETHSTPDALVGSRDEESAELAMDYIARRLGVAATWS